MAGTVASMLLHRFPLLRLHGLHQSRLHQLFCPSIAAARAASLSKITRNQKQNPWAVDVSDVFASVPSLRLYQHGLHQSRLPEYCLHECSPGRRRKDIQVLGVRDIFPVW